MQSNISFKRALLSAASLSFALAFAPCASSADPLVSEKVCRFNIPSQELGDALRLFSEQSSTPVLFSGEAVSGKQAPRLQGSYLPEAGLKTLLGGSGLETVEGPGGVRIVRPEREEARASGALSRTRPQPAPDPDEPDNSATETSTETLRAEKITVTGTSLRGLAPESSPLQVYGRDEVLGSGATSLDQFIRALPQNFGGGSTEFTSIGLPNDSNSRQNNTSGASANLRGLGSRGTLVLINGNRMAPTSEIGDFVDLSLIPMAAIERVEVLTDGASSIYGGDAVAGVINFILRDDFEGAETTASYGTVTEGRMEEYRFSQTLGSAWDSGNLIGTYEYSSRDNLTLADRPDIGLFEPRVDGDILPDARFLDLLPAQERHSLLLSGSQQVSPKLGVSASALYSKRDTERTRFNRNTSIDVYETESEGLTLAFAADYELSASWAANLDVSYGQIRNKEGRFRIEDGIRPDDPVDDVRTDSDLWSLDFKLDGDLFSLPGGTVKAAVGGHLRREEFSNEILGLQITADGDRDVSALYAEVQVPLIGEQNALPGVRRLELNLSGRLDDYSDFGTSSNPKLGLLWSPADGINLRGSYSTSFAPPPLGRAFSLGRTGQLLPYDFMLGFIGEDAPDPSLNGTGYIQVFGTAKDLDPETSETFTAGLDAAWSRGGHDWALSATYYDISFEGRLGSTPIPQGLTDISAPGIAWDNPGAFPAGSVVFFPSAQEIDDLVASFDTPIALFFGATLDNVGVINYVNVVRNLARTDTSGLDLQLDYGTDTPLGRLDAGINANHILDFTQQAAAGTAAVETLNTYLNPVDLTLRGHASLSRGGLTASAFINYVDNYQVDQTEGADGISAWTTVDATLSYDLGARRSGWLSGVGLALSVTNLFDEAPPMTPADGAYSMTAYDPTNASPLGRFVTFEVRKAF
ncbi:TonB-dependent receptor [Hyphomonas sp. ND6WE1B]|uniref:TonB-dependent receptor n=1 Tax=Hyphomonas sp. ND6WE1B TaxID=1848191 RepID=UPI00080765E1|nr:TonB-dependent receptor [Hyphomonas sp. ND6WE1B]